MCLEWNLTFLIRNYSEADEHTHDLMSIIQQLNDPDVEFTAGLTFRLPLSRPVSEHVKVEVINEGDRHGTLS